MIVLDIDGVITGGESRALDLAFLGDLAEVNRRAQKDGAAPAVTLVTGRPAPYLEAMLQAIDGHLPGIYENGAGIYFPQDYRFQPHPLLEGKTALGEVRRRIEAQLVASGRAFIQPGKEHTLTLFATDPAETFRLHEYTADALAELAGDVDLVYSTSCLNVLPKVVDKGVGLIYLAERVGIPPANMLGVGDSDVDLPFLALTRHTAAPSNAMPQVKAVVDYVSPEPTSAGVRDIFEHFDVRL